MHKAVKWRGGGVPGRVECIDVRVAQGWHVSCRCVAVYRITIIGMWWRIHLLDMG